MECKISKSGTPLECVSSSLRQTDAVLSFYRDVITWVDPDREL